MTKTWVVTLLLVGATPGISGAEGVSPGETVRISGPLAGKRLVGRVRAFEDGALVVAVENGDTARVPLAWIDDLEVRRPRSRWASAGKGALIGMAVGGASFAALCAFDRSCIEPGWMSWAIASGAFGGAQAGALIGALAGGGERWQPVEPGEIRVSVSPIRGGVGAQLTLGF